MEIRLRIPENKAGERGSICLADFFYLLRKIFLILENNRLFLENILEFNRFFAALGIEVLYLHHPTPKF